MGTGGPFPGGKARPGRDADHSPLSSAEVKNDPSTSMAGSGSALLYITCTGHMRFDLLQIINDNDIY
jgi:hypothetical protein